MYINSEVMMDLLLDYKYYEQFKEELSVNEKISISILKSKFSTLILKRESKKIQEEMKIK